MLPGGTRQSDPARFYRVGDNALFWTSTEDSYDGGMFDFLWSYDTGDEGGRSYSGSAEGYSVRCEGKIYHELTTSGSVHYDEGETGCEEYLHDHVPQIRHRTIYQREYQPFAFINNDGNGPL